MNKPATLTDDELNKIRKANRNNNDLINDAICEYLTFNDEEKRTKEGLIEIIKHFINTAQYNYNQYGKDNDYSIQCINGAKTILAKIEGSVKTGKPVTFWLSNKEIEMLEDISKKTKFKKSFIVSQGIKKMNEVLKNEIYLSD